MESDVAEVLGKLTYGVYLLTTIHKKTKYGMIVSWVNQVSYNPPLVAVAVRKTRRILPFIEKTGLFSIQVLENTQKDILSHFKHPDLNERFLGLSYHILDSGTPLLTNVLGYIECRLHDEIVPGDHAILIGEIVSGRCLENQGKPLTCDELGKVYLGKY